MNNIILPDIDFDRPVYGLGHDEKQSYINSHMVLLKGYHADRCERYKNFVEFYGQSMESHTRAPSLFASLFKQYELRSTDKKNIFKTIYSSGTAGLRSAIYLDRETANLQSRALGKILQSILGKNRPPLLTIDHNQLLKNPASFSARGAGVQGLAFFCRDQSYLLNEDSDVDWSVLDSFYLEYKKAPALIFGFTSFVWEFLLKRLVQENRFYQFENLYLMHTGGWKKLEDKAVDRKTYNNLVKELLGENTKIHNFYGMAEQTGSIYMECEMGYLHAPIYADINILNPVTLLQQPMGEQGLIETLSILPRSYPGHGLITQDIGAVIGEDDCQCGRLGKYFVVHGRQNMAEVRGCSDSY